MIEVGEYVRTKRGDINKVIGIREELRDGKRIYGHKAYYLDRRKGSLTEAFIIKHSKNIIDLIEEGDYVNGSKLLSIDYAEDKFGNCDKLHFYYSFEDDEKDVNEYYESLKIKSIVTKEQFKSIEYRLEE